MGKCLATLSGDVGIGQDGSFVVKYKGSGQVVLSANWVSLLLVLWTVVVLGFDSYFYATG